MTEYTNETLVNLIREAKSGTEQNNYLIMLYQQNHPIIAKICRKFTSYAEFDDLMQEAFFGVKNAVEQYDYDKGVPFINYANIHIEAIIYKYLENNGYAIRIPSNIYFNLIKYSKAELTFIRDHGRHPSDQELKELLSLNLDQLKKIKEYADVLKMISFDKQINSEDGSAAFADIVPDPIDCYEEITDKIDADQKSKVLWEEVQRLKDDQSQVITKHYRDSVPLSSMAKSMGISCEAVRQIKLRGLKSLRNSKRIQQYANEYTSAKAYSGTGFASFIHSGSSATERVAINNYNRDLERFIRETKREIRRIERKYKIILDDGYLQRKIDEYTEAHAMTV